MESGQSVKDKNRKVLGEMEVALEEAGRVAHEAEIALNNSRNRQEEQQKEQERLEEKLSTLEYERGTGRQESTSWMYAENRWPTNWRPQKAKKL